MRRLLHLVVVLLLLTGSFEPGMATMPCCAQKSAVAAPMPGMNMGQDGQARSAAGTCTHGGLCDVAVAVVQEELHTCDEPVCAPLAYRSAAFVQMVSLDMGAPPASTHVGAVQKCGNPTAVRGFAPVPNPLRVAALPLRV